MLTKTDKIYSKLIQYIVCTTFLIITVMIYIPCSLYLTNIAEFGVEFKTVFPYFFIGAVALLAIMLGVGIIIKSDEIRKIVNIFVFGLGLAVYFQINFLNKSLPVLSGTEIDWSRYMKHSIIGVAVWIFIFLSCFIVYRYVKYEITGKIILFAAVALSVMQISSLIFLIANNDFHYEEKKVYTKEGLYDIGEENVVLFIVDTLDTKYIEEYLRSEYYENELADFDFFGNMVSGGAPTSLGVPTLLTGIEYDPNQGYSEYIEYAVNNSVLDVYNKCGYDSRIYTSEDIYNGASNIAEAEGNEIKDDIGFVKEMYGTSLYMAVPYILKKFFYKSTEKVLSTIGTYDYSINNVEFYDGLIKKREIKVEGDKKLRIIHLWGIHPPYYNNEKCESVGENHKESEALAGVFYELNTYFNYLKKAGKYDNTTIIVTGDHGANKYNALYYRPAVLVKLSKGYEAIRNKTDAMAECDGVRCRIDAQCSFWNLNNLLRMLSGDDNYGATIYDVAANVYIERKHSVDRALAEYANLDWKFLNNYARVRLVNNGDLSKFEEYNNKELYDIYDSKKINNVLYTNGNNLLLDKNLTDGIIKEDNSIITGYEFSVCLKLKNYKDGDIILNGIYNSIYGKTQDIVIFANKEYVDTIRIKADEENNRYTISIPEYCLNSEYVDEDTLIIRQVFPFAVLDDDRIKSVNYKTLELTYR